MTDVIVERRGEVAWIRLNRPERRNAYDLAMAEEVTAAVRSAADSAAIVVTGSGGAFCAGGFLADLSDPDVEELRVLFDSSLRMFDEIRNSPRPVIAAVNGSAAGGGNELVVACDFAIAAASAKLGQTGPRVGSAPVLGGNNLLSLSVGEKRGKEISMLCRRYDAETACELGWVNAVVPDDELEAEVDRWVEEILQLSPRYLEIAKVSSNVWWNQMRDSYRSGLALLMQAAGSEDMVEGANAFMEKRKPRFRDERARRPVSLRAYREFEFEFPDRETWTLPWMLRRRAQTHGDKVYLDVPDHGESFTFTETLAEAEAIGRGFLDHGGEHGDRVLMMAPNRAELVLGWYGAALAGMVEVPINTAYASTFLEHQVRTTTPRFAVISAEYSSRFVEGETTAYDSIERFFLFGEPADQRRAIEVLRGGGREASPYEDLLRPNSETEFPMVDRRDAGAIFFTSGTTGLSKGVTMSHSQLCFVSQQLIALVRLSDRDTHMSVGPLFHGNAQFLAASPDLIAGARFVVREKYSASRWIDQIRDCGATVTNFIGVMMDWTYQQPERPDDADNQLRCIYTVPTPNAILADFSRRFGVDNFVEQYGMTEISLPVMTPYGAPRPEGAAGLLADEFFEAKIVDPETDEELPPNTVGEFVIRPKEPWIMLTDYWNMPDRTAEASRNMWFHTGDGLKRDEQGWFYFVDRLKDAIRRRGENISSYEVEQAVLVHEKVFDVAAVAAPAFAEAGEDEVAVFFVLEDGQEMSVEELREWCAAQLPLFAVPAYVSVVPELPKTPSGKVRKAELRQLAAEQANRSAGADRRLAGPTTRLR